MTEEKKREKLFSINKDLFYSISNIEFDDMIFNSSTPALVLFGAERCAVCKELNSTLEEILPDYAGKLNSYYVDVDRYKDLMKRFRLRGIPTVLLFNDGEVKERIVGVQSMEQLVEVIDRALS